MSTKETARRCRAEIWDPTLMDRQPWVNWEVAGAPTMYDRVRARLREILATHKPPPMPDGAAEQIEAILQAAEAREKQSGKK
jgi:trimethylamine:corrinoid methyltransferase-like protein